MGASAGSSAVASSNSAKRSLIGMFSSVISAVSMTWVSSSRSGRCGLVVFMIVFRFIW
ncbi:hypothetical protein [Bifidobacterium pseudolongum]|uniref:hypothetical protein n=1 Tax=Bifidobacterium pseudolongum TaxID=1694 RepID=UPI000B315AE2|nr:hypothetical protein [Bifidobacterium pseudolongum]